MPYTGKVSNAGISVDTNNDGIPDGRAMTVRNGGNFSTFSLTNGVLTVQPATAGASAAGSDTQVQFNDGGTAFGGHTGMVYDKTFATNAGKLTVANLVISGDLTVSGTTTTINTTNVNLADNIIVLNSDATGSPSASAGIEIERGSETNVQFLWDETNDQWDFDTFALGSVGKVYAAGAGAVYTFTSDTNTGIEHTGVDQLGLLAGGVRVLMVNTNGVHIAPAGATGASADQALLVDNISIDTNTIASVNTNGNIVVAPNGTGDVQLDADTVRVGDSGADATITTNGAGDLVLNTNAGTNSGSITIEDGANNHILIMPDGTGKVGINQATPTHRLHVDGDALITGGLTVQGTTTTASTTNTLIADSLITLNEGESGTGVTGNIAGFEIDRGASGEIARFVWDDNDDYFKPQIETGAGTGTYNTANLKVNIFDAAGEVTVAGNLTVDTNVLYVDVANNWVGINKTPTVELDVSGSALISTNLTVSGDTELTGRTLANRVVFTPQATNPETTNPLDTIWLNSETGHLMRGERDTESTVHFNVRNDEGATIPLGAPLYSKGEIGGSERIKVGIADASDPAKMPAIGVAMEEMNTTSTQDGNMIITGVLNENITITGVTERDIIYVAPHGGTAPYLTVTRPTSGSHLVQNIGVCVRQTTTNISQGMKVSAIGRTNDIPNGVITTDSADADYVYIDDGNTFKKITPADLGIGGGGGGASEAFKTIAVSGQSDVVADSATDTLTLVGAGSAVITTNAASDTITITADTNSDTTDSLVDTYNPGVVFPPAGAPTVWNPPPAVVAEALDRLSVYVTSILGGPIP